MNICIKCLPDINIVLRVLLMVTHKVLSKLSSM